MRKFFALSLLAGLVAAGAYAQTSKPVGLALRAGAFFPSDKDARDYKEVWLGLGAEYKLKDLNLGSGVAGYQGGLSVSLDYIGHKDARALPLLLNYTGRQDQFFYSAGVGAGFNREFERGKWRNETKLAYQVGIGYDFVTGGTPFFVEGKYFGASGSDLGGFGIYLGIRL